MQLFVVMLILPVVVPGQQDEDWIDPFDMLNYDSATKTMKKPPAQTENYDNVPAERTERPPGPEHAALETCTGRLRGLQSEVEYQKKAIRSLEQQPTCNPVLRRFLSRLLKDVDRLGLPTQSTNVIYDAKLSLSSHAVAEIQAFLKGGDSCRSGALDNAISQVLVELKPHDYEVWRWRFEDTFGVDLDTVNKAGLFFMIIAVTVCTQLWSVVSWFVQFKRLFVLCFFISVIWNWFYLYKIAFAEHQNNMVKMDDVVGKCTGMKKIDWTDSLTEWVRGTWTLQDDPCKRYYEVLLVNPILLVPPTKAISVTITTFITEPLKHVGQGISEFLRALLKDLPITLQIPVLLTIVIAIVVCLYGSVQAAFQYGITAPFRRPGREPRPPPVDQPPHLLRIRNGGHVAEDQPPQNGARAGGNGVRQRRPHRNLQVVESVGSADRAHSEDATYAEAEMTEILDASEADSQLETDSDDQQGEPAAIAASKPAQKPCQSHPASAQVQTKMVKKKKKPPPEDEPRRPAEGAERVVAAPPGTGAPQNGQQQASAGAGAQVHGAPAADVPRPPPVDEIETLGPPVQESVNGFLAQ